MRLFNQLGKADKVKVANRIGKQTFVERWNVMDTILPDEVLTSP